MNKSQEIDQIVDKLLNFQQNNSQMPRNERTAARQLWYIINRHRKSVPNLQDILPDGSTFSREKLRAVLEVLLQEDPSAYALAEELIPKQVISDIPREVRSNGDYSVEIKGNTVFNIGRDVNVLGNIIISEDSKSRMSTTNMPTDNRKWDVFISYASEDREVVAYPLAESLRAIGLQVWFDQFELKPGDMLLQSIDEGLRSSDYGIVILSPHFFGKEWTQQELGGLFQRMTGEKRKPFIIPIWYLLDASDVRQFSPILSNLIAIPWKTGMNQVVQKILTVIKPGVSSASSAYATVFSKVFSALLEDDFKSQVRLEKDSEHTLPALRTISTKSDYPLKTRSRALETLIDLDGLDPATLEKLLTIPDSGWTERLISVLSRYQYNLSENQIKLLLENSHLPKVTNGLGEFICNIVQQNHHSSRVFLPARSYPQWQVKYDCVRSIIRLDDNDTMETLQAFSPMKYWQARRHIVDYILSRIKQGRLSGKDQEIAVQILKQIVNDGKTDPNTPTMSRAKEALAKATGDNSVLDPSSADNEHRPDQNAKYIIYVNNGHGFVIGDNSTVNQEFNKAEDNEKCEDNKD